MGRYQNIFINMNTFTKMLVITSNPSNISKVENYLNNIKEQYTSIDERYPDILISLTEAVNNAIIHGNKEDETKKVKINMVGNASSLEVHVSDEGPGFDAEEVPDPTSPDNIECCGGRGVFIMTSLADRLSYRNNGSTVEMYFKLR